MDIFWYPFLGSTAHALLCYLPPGHYCACSQLHNKFVSISTRRQPSVRARDMYGQQTCCRQYGRKSPVSSEMYAVAKFMTSAKCMTLTLTLTLSLAKYLTSKYLTHAQIAQIGINFASHKFRATPVLDPNHVSGRIFFVIKHCGLRSCSFWLCYTGQIMIS